jgi:hypothetical protein
MMNRDHDEVTTEDFLDPAFVASLMNAYFAEERPLGLDVDAASSPVLAGTIQFDVEHDDEQADLVARLRGRKRGPLRFPSRRSGRTFPSCTRR